jgi:hypothetical protein
MAIRQNQRRNLEVRWAGEFGKNAHGKLMILGRPSFQWEGAPSPEEFYKQIGFDEVHTLDVSPHQGATHIHDLNNPLPAELAGQYDMAISGGTLEHVFDVASALRCLAGLAKVGGLIMCGAPVNNWIDHGFYQISPTLKFDFFHANQFQFEESRAVLTDPSESSTRLFPLYPGEAHRWNSTKRKLAHTLVVRRDQHSTLDRVPLQGVYYNLLASRRRKFRFKALAPTESVDGVVSEPQAERFPLQDFRAEQGAWVSPFQNPKYLASLEKLPFRSSALVYEDGQLLPWIVSEPSMVNERPGSFFHSPRFIHFSTTDGSDPGTNGKSYEVVFPDLTSWRR